jgi:hypothetical protein
MLPHSKAGAKLSGGEWVALKRKPILGETIRESNTLLD